MPRAVLAQVITSGVNGSPADDARRSEKPLIAGFLLSERYTVGAAAKFVTPSSVSTVAVTSGVKPACSNTFGRPIAIGPRIP